jgi:1,4-alpha-glucan branching enzyme
MTRAVSEGGFGFTFKWNLGWMHDTLAHFERQPNERGAHQNELLFSMAYEHDERFVNALSHDEVVHGKRSLLARMPGPLEKQLANLRLLLAYQYTRPGKKLLFMGMELGAATEWDHDRGLDWSLEDDLSRRQFQAYLSELGRVYLDSPALWHSDPDPEGFAWLESGPGGGSVLTYQRRDGQDRLVVVLNLSATLVKDFWVQVPGVRPYRVLLSTADPAFGGRGGTPGPELHVEARPGAVSSGRLRFDLPPLTGLLLLPT